MEHIIHLASWRRDGRAAAQRVINRVASALRSGLLVVLQITLGAFVVGYPLLRLGYLGPTPLGYDLEAAFGIVAGAMAALLFLLEGGE